MTPERLALAIESLLEDHPLQYEYTDTARNRVERYNRCPVCEQWSPCDVRIVLAALAAAQADVAEAADQR